MPVQPVSRPCRRCWYLSRIGDGLLLKVMPCDQSNAAIDRSKKCANEQVEINLPQIGSLRAIAHWQKQGHTIILVTILGN